MNIIGILFFITLFGFIVYHQTRLFYDRYLKSYKKDFKEYLRERGYEYIDKWDPAKDDWNHSPFVKPPVFSISLVITEPIQWTKIEYYILIAKKSDKYKEFWVEITTSYFRKTKLIFKAGNNIKYNADVINLNKEYCPKCSYMLFNFDEKKCPNCNFHLTN
jgi:hypothetical protein